MKNLVFQIKNLVFWSKTLDFDRKTQVFQTRKSEMLGFSQIEFEILGISSEIPGISKSHDFDSKAGTENKIMYGGYFCFFHVWTVEMNCNIIIVARVPSIILDSLNNIAIWPLTLRLTIDKYGCLAMKTSVVYVMLM